MKPLKGVVVKVKTEKTAVVLVERFKVHPVYKKRLRVKKKFLVHDETGVKQGDWVRIQECRPVSKRKRWRVVEIIGKNKETKKNKKSKKNEKSKRIEKNQNNKISKKNKANEKADS